MIVYETRKGLQSEVMKRTKRRNAPKNSVKKFTSRERERAFPEEVKKTPNSRGLFNLSARYSPERLDSNENVPHVHKFEQKYSEAPGGIFVLESRYKKGGCLLLHAIRRTILVESYELKLKVQLRSRIYRR